MSCFLTFLYFELSSVLLLLLYKFYTGLSEAILPKIIIKMMKSVLL